MSSNENLLEFYHERSSHWSLGDALKIPMNQNNTLFQ